MSWEEDDIFEDGGEEIEVELKHETDEAYQVVYKNETAWIPKSQVKMEDLEQQGPGGYPMYYLSIPYWLYSKKF